MTRLYSFCMKQSKPKQIWWLVSLLLVLQLSSIPEVVVAHAPHDNCDALDVSRDGGVVYVANRGTLLRSTDDGNTWEYIVRDLPASNPTGTYLALSPYNDEPLYVYSGGFMWRSSDLKDWEEVTAPVFNVEPCERYHYKILKKRTVFSKTHGALIAGKGNVLYKENGSGFTKVNNANFNNCPSLAAVYDSNIVYAGASNGLMRSNNGGQTWDLIVSMKNIVEVEAKDGQVFVMTTSGICHLNEATNKCNDIGLPDTTAAEKVRGGSSPPTSMSYHGGILYVTRANSYALYICKDYASKVWTSLSKQQDGNFVTLGHVGGDVGWFFSGVEEFTHAVGSYVGSWLGLFKTNNGGNTWMYRDTISKAITTLSLSKAKDGKFTVAVGTYNGGCYVGPPDDLKLVTPTNLNSVYYNAFHLSPSYGEDGIAFERGELDLFRFDTGKRVNLNPVYSSAGIRIKGLVFSPSFATDGTVFVVGHNLGVLASYDRGQTFTTRLFDGREFGRVYRLVVSPNFSEDGTMACMADPNFDGNDWQLDDDVQYIYLSQDKGKNWRRLVWDSRPFRDIVIVAGDPLPIVVAIDNKGLMWARSSELTSWAGFQQVSNTIFSAVRPLGYAEDGLAVSPNGRLLASAWNEGAISFGEISLHKISNRYNSYPGPWADTSQPPIVFARTPRDVPDVQGRQFTSHVAFSPDFEDDGIIVAADMFSVYISYNEGKSFNKVFTL